MCFLRKSFKLGTPLAVKPNTILASWATWVLSQPDFLRPGSWFLSAEGWFPVCRELLQPQDSCPSWRTGAVLYSKASGGQDGAVAHRGCWGQDPTVPWCLHCGVVQVQGAWSSSPQATGRLQDVQTPQFSFQVCQGPTSAQVWGWASCLGSPQSPQQAEATAATAAGTQGGLIKLGCVATCCNHSLNDCKFGLVDLLNPCIFSVPVCCKSQTFSIFFIWFQKTVSVLKTSLWKMLVYPAVLFYLGWLHN